MASATEIALLPLHANATLEQAGSSSHTTWRELLDTVSRQQGYQRLYWGRKVEEPNVVALLIDWDSIEAHQAFMASSEYGHFEEQFGEILDGSAQLYHANLDPHPPTPAFSAPVTECLILYFPTSFDTSSFDSHWPVVLKMLEEKAAGFAAASAGWVIEDLENDGEKCKAWAGFLGWESVDAHLTNSKSAAFREAIGGLMVGARTYKRYDVVLEEK